MLSEKIIPCDRKLQLLNCMNFREYVLSFTVNPSQGSENLNLKWELLNK
jgi:hypothetical protein